MAQCNTRTLILSGPNYEESGISYEHLLPWEAARISKTGIAIGFDPLRFGEAYSRKFHGDNTMIAIATTDSVRFMHLLNLEKSLINDSYDRNRMCEELGIDPTKDQDEGNRRKIRLYRQALKRRVDAANTVPWDELTRTNREYLLSLLWTPEVPVSPLEMLARSLD